MRYKITVALINGDTHNEEVEAVDADSPLTAVPLAMAGAFVSKTNVLTNPVTLPSGIQGDLINVELLDTIRASESLQNDQPTTRVY